VWLFPAVDLLVLACTLVGGVMKSAEQILGCLPGLQGGPTRWPFQPLPGWHDFEHDRVLCHPRWQEVVDTLRTEEPVLMVGPRSSGKTVTALKISYELLRRLQFPVISFFDAQSVFSEDGKLNDDFVYSIQDWPSKRMPKLGIVEDVHSVDADISDFLTLVEPYRATWLFTGRFDIDLPVSKIAIQLDRFWVETVIQKVAELAKTKGLILPVRELVQELEEPDLRVIYFVLRTLLKRGRLDNWDITEAVLNHIHEEYLSDETGTYLLQLAAISQFEVPCDAGFFDAFPDQLIREGIVERKMDVGGKSVLSIDATLARWLLQSRDKRSATSILPGQQARFVVEILSRYVGTWRLHALKLLVLLVEQQAPIAYEVLRTDVAFRALKDHIRELAAPTLVKMLQVLSIDQKKQLTNSTGASDIREYLAQSQGIDFGRAMFQLSLVEVGRSLIADIDKADPEFIERKLAESGNLGVFYSVFSSLRAWPERLMTLLGRVDFEPPISKLSHLGPLLRCVQFLKSYSEHERLLDVARKQPTKVLADVARKSPLWETRYMLDFLMADPRWPVVSFVEACKSLRASFEAANLASVGQFLSLLRAKAKNERRPELREVWQKFSARALECFDIRKVTEIEDLRRLLGGLAPKDRQSLLARLASDDHVLSGDGRYSEVFSTLINQGEMAQVGKFIDLLHTLGHRTASQQVADLILPSTWDRWTEVKDNNWAALLSAGPLFLTIKEKCELHSIPSELIRSKLGDFLALDEDLLSITVRQIGLNRTADAVLAARRAGLDPHRILTVLEHSQGPGFSQDPANAEASLRAAGKLIAYSNHHSIPVPEWLTVALQTSLHGPFSPDANLCFALNNLIHHLAAAGNPLCVGFYRELRKILDTDAGLWRDPRIQKDWLWNMLSVEGKDTAAHCLFHHLDEYLDSLRRGTSQEVLFLLWNGWLISPSVAKESCRAIRRRLHYITTQAQLQPWEKYCLRSLLDLCGSRIRTEPVDISELEKLLLTNDNPAVFFLLAYALRRSTKAQLPSHILERAEVVLQSVRDVATKALFAEDLDVPVFHTRAS
jgi:hypothetical protein